MSDFVHFLTALSEDEIHKKGRKTRLTRLGLMIPSSNTTMEPEFCRLLPKDFTVHSCRLRLKEVTLEDLAKMEEEIEEEAPELADADVNVIGFGCTSGSLFRGLGHDKQIEAKIEKITGIPVVSTAGAVVHALKVMKIKDVAVATPYIESINRLEEKFLVANGFRISDVKTLGIKDNLKIGKLTSQDAYELVRELKSEKADGIFVSCTNFATFSSLEKMENDTQKVVVSSNSATLWAMLKKCGVQTGIKGYGKLLERI